jgi:hypothetical protein
VHSDHNLSIFVDLHLRVLGLLDARAHVFDLLASCLQDLTVLLFQLLYLHQFLTTLREQLVLFQGGLGKRDRQLVGRCLKGLQVLKILKSYITEGAWFLQGLLKDWNVYGVKEQ